MGKPSQTCCVPVLLRVNRKFKQENILLDVVNWVVSQSMAYYFIFVFVFVFPCFVIIAFCQFLTLRSIL